MGDVYLPITISDIDIPAGRREVVAASVKKLADSIDRVGLRHPITVREKGDRYILVAGRHRIEACKKLGREHIPATIVKMTNDDARLWEIAENLHRAELTKLERDDNIAEWIKITERVDALQVATHRKAGQQPGGINAASRELGIDATDAHRAVKVASLSDEAKDAARETGLDNNRSALLAAARETGPEAQVAKITNYNPKHYDRLKKLHHHIAITEFVADLESNFCIMVEKYTPDELSELFLRVGQAIVKWRDRAATSARSSKPERVSG